jgi:hypothetical protein
VDPAHLAGLALDSRREETRLVTSLRCDLACGVDRVAARRDHVRLDGDVGGGLRGRSPEPLADRRRLDVVPVQHRQRGGRVDPLWHRRSAGDDCGVVADHVADEEADDRRRSGRRRETAALDIRAGPPDDVHLVDRRARSEEGRGHRREVVGREVARRRTEQGAPAAGDGGQNERVRVGRLAAPEHEHVVVRREVVLGVANLERPVLEFAVPFDGPCRPGGLDAGRQAVQREFACRRCCERRAVDEHPTR